MALNLKLVYKEYLELIPFCQASRKSEAYLINIRFCAIAFLPGRTGPGVCYRLYDEADYNDFQDYSTPELQRVPLDSLILQMISMGLPDARKSVFLMLIIVLKLW